LAKLNLPKKKIQAAIAKYGKYLAVAILSALGVSVSWIELDQVEKHGLPPLITEANLKL